MNAVDFVKKFGWEKAVEVIKNRPPMNSARYRPSDNKYSSTLSSGQAVCTVQLKRLVESWELVKVGLPELKQSMFSESRDLEYVKNWILSVSDKLLTKKGMKLKKAIADVESVGGGV